MTSRERYLLVFSLVDEGHGFSTPIRAMPVTARVVGRLGAAARKAHVQVPAQHGGAATLDGAQHRVLIGSEGVGASERPAVLANDVGELHDGARAARTVGCAAVVHDAVSAERGVGRPQRRQSV
jgi:hypothetical protein